MVLTSLFIRDLEIFIGVSITRVEFVVKQDSDTEHLLSTVGFPS